MQHTHTHIYIYIYIYIWMQNVREKQILRILAQESLNLELLLERYDHFNFWRLFCEF
jgi:hypothetical protein